MSNQRFPADEALGRTRERIQSRAMTLEFCRTLFIVAALNLAYFGVEFAVALVIGSVSLFADCSHCL